VLQRQQAADQIENNLPVWEARIAQQIAAVSRIDTAIERAQRRLTETELRAPFSAFVTEVGAQVGRLVSSNDKVATLIDRNWIEVRFNLTDEQFGRIVAKEGPLDGRQVEVRWVLGNNTFTYTATIERIGARISSATGGVEVYARIKDPSQPVPLHPGAFVEIDVPDTKFNSAFRLPSTALYSGNTVYVIEKERLIPRKVRVIGGIENDILIEGEISDGDRVMITRISTPGEGVKVTEAKSQ
jgi:RND family efflux transporter MFP subunit